LDYRLTIRLTPRATGITNFLENDGALEAAQRIAGHADSRTTKLYDRRGQKVLLEDMERIRYLAGKEHEMPVHYLLEEVLNEYIVAAGLQLRRGRRRLPVPHPPCAIHPV
jgi:hypothetical protein